MLAPVFAPRKNFTVYITTNSSRTVLYCGMTNDLSQRIIEHYIMRGQQSSFAGKYSCYWLVYYEDCYSVKDAIERETQIKKWRREKKDALIEEFNPGWKFLNKVVIGEWPRKNAVHRKDLMEE